MAFYSYFALVESLLLHFNFLYLEILRATCLKVAFGEIVGKSMKKFMIKNNSGTTKA